MSRPTRVDTEYKYLVGADGSFSRVRGYLGLPMEHVAGWAYHYVVENPAHEFRVCWLPKIFPNGYGYVMSKNKNATMVGGAMTGKIGMKDLAPRVKGWVENEFKLDTSKLKSEGFRGNAEPGVEFEKDGRRRFSWQAMRRDCSIP